MDGKIESARITPLPKGWSDPLPQVFVKVAGHPEQFLFDYFHDEISFSPEEFVGLTIREACELKHAKDVAYLRS